MVLLLETLLNTKKFGVVLAVVTNHSQRNLARCCTVMLFSLSETDSSPNLVLHRRADHIQRVAVSCAQRSHPEVPSINTSEKSQVVIHATQLHEPLLRPAHR